MAQDMRSEELRRKTWRQRLRNPSVPLVVITFVIVIGVLLAVFGPPIQRRGAEGLGQVRKLTPNQFRDPPETWIRPWIITKINVMRDATQAYQWYPTDFEHEACAEDWITVLPTQKYQDAVRSACHDLLKIQTEYASACDQTGCSIPDAAIRELNGVEQRLNEAYAGAFTPVAGPTIRLSDEP